jgi:hypothetical protein
MTGTNGTKIGDFYKVQQMTTSSKKYFDFMRNIRLDLRGKNGRQIFRENYLAVSAVKRAAEGEI